MNEKLLEQYAAAVRVRPLIKRLPDGVREWSLQYERMALDDLRGQAGDQTLTEDELLAMAGPSIMGVLAELWPVIQPLAVVVLKKYAPTIAASGTIGAAIAYLTK